MMYAVKINNRIKPTYIEWCNNCWYGTIFTKVCIFTYEQAKQIVEWLKNHYVYDVTIIGNDGTQEVCCCLKSHKSIMLVENNQDDNDEDFWCF